MNTKYRRQGRRWGSFLLFALLTCTFFHSGILRADDGDGVTAAAPNAVIRNSTGNDIDFTYDAASSPSGDGTVRLTTPGGWPDPTANNTSVEAVHGMLADILDGMNPPVLGNGQGSTGWNASAELLNIPLQLLTPQLSADAAEKIEGSHSLSVQTTIGLTLLSPVLSQTVYRNLSAQANWSGYELISFWIKTDAVLSAGLSLGASEFTVASGLDLDGNVVTYELDESFIDLDLALLQSGQWTRVIIDLTKGGSITPPSSVRSFGLVLGTSGLPIVTVNLLTEVNLDAFKLGGPAAQPVFDGNEVTANLMFLDSDGKVIFHYMDVTAPDSPGDYTFPMDHQSDASGVLVEVKTGSPVVQVVDASSCIRMADTDGDGNQELACDTDGDGCYGDAYIDPDGSSNACLNIDGNNDGCPDFFIDTDGSGCTGECPEVFWDPTQEILSEISEVDLDVDGDNVPDQVCAYDSDGDGDDDSFVDPDGTGDSGIGGEGGGGGNPFIQGGSGCAMTAGASPAAAMTSLALGLCTMLVGVGMRMRKEKTVKRSEKQPRYTE